MTWRRSHPGAAPKGLNTRTSAAPAHRPEPPKSRHPRRRRRDVESRARPHDPLRRVEAAKWVEGRVLLTDSSPAADRPEPPRVSSPAPPDVESRSSPRPTRPRRGGEVGRGSRPLDELPGRHAHRVLVGLHRDASPSLQTGPGDLTPVGVEEAKLVKGRVPLTNSGGPAERSLRATEAPRREARGADDEEDDPPPPPSKAVAGEAGPADPARAEGAEPFAKRRRSAEAARRSRGREAKPSTSPARGARPREVREAHRPQGAAGDEVPRDG